jgi:hypothetical protein
MQRKRHVRIERGGAVRNSTPRPHLITRWTIRKTGASSWGWAANSKRSGIGNESTHCAPG